MFWVAFAIVASYVAYGAYKYATRPNPADQAAVEQAEYNKAEAHKAAEKHKGTLIENVADFSSSAEYQLSQGIAYLGKMGALDLTGDTGAKGFLKNADIDDVAYRMPYYSVSDPRLGTRQELPTVGELTEGDDVEEEVTEALEADIAEIESVFGEEHYIETSAALQYVSGTYLDHVSHSVELMKEDRMRIIEGGLQDIYAMRRAGEHYDKMTDYAEMAAEYNRATRGMQWLTNTLMGGVSFLGGMSLSAMGFPQVGIPMMISGGSQTMGAQFR